MILLLGEYLSDLATFLAILKLRLVSRVEESTGYG